VTVAMVKRITEQVKKVCSIVKTKKGMLLAFWAIVQIGYNSASRYRTR
jgi:hypothetical protein